MPEEQQRTIEEQAARNRRGQQLLDRREVPTGDPYRKLLLLILDDRIGSRDTYALTFASIAGETEMHESTARRKAAELREQGLIDFEETAPGSSLYTFRIIRSNVAELAEAHRQSRGPSPRTKRGRPRKKTRTVQKDFAEGKKDLQAAKTFCSVQNAPFIERPLNAISNDPITHAADPRKKNGDGDGVRKNEFGGWRSPIQVSEMTSLTAVQDRYLEAVEQGWVTDTESNQIHFFALSRYCAKAAGIKRRPNAFTFFLKNQKWSVIRCEDLDAAEKAVRQIRHAGRMPIPLEVGPAIPAGDPARNRESELEKLKAWNDAGSETD